MMKTKRISVVGAGIGGLTTAIALLRRGFEVTVFEQASALGEIGAGVQLSPNAMKVIDALGLADAFLAVAFEPNRHVVKNWKTGGDTSATQMRGEYRKKHGAGYYGVHRADLHAVLIGALPRDAVKLDARCTGVSADGDRALLALADGRTIE